MGDEPRVFAVPFPSSLLTPEHREKLGAAVWTYLVLIDRVTRTVEGEDGTRIGLVYGGAPVKTEEIASRLGLNEWTVRTHLDVLEEVGCVRKRRTRRGLSLEVLNCLKRLPGDDRRKTHDHDQTRSGKNPRSYPWKNPRSQTSSPGENPRSHHDTTSVHDSTTTTSTPEPRVEVQEGDALKGLQRPDSDLSDAERLERVFNQVTCRLPYTRKQISDGVRESVREALGKAVEVLGLDVAEGVVRETLDALARDGDPARSIRVCLWPLEEKIKEVRREQGYIEISAESRRRIKARRILTYSDPDDPG